MKIVCFALTVFLMFGISCCEDEPCVEADGCYVDVIDPKWVAEMNEAFTKKSLDVKVNKILKITRRAKEGNEVHSKAEIVTDDGRSCSVTWVETAQHADDWIPDIAIDCGTEPETTSATSNSD